MCTSFIFSMLVYDVKEITGLGYLKTIIIPWQPELMVQVQNSLNHIKSS